MKKVLQIIATLLLVGSISYLAIIANRDYQKGTCTGLHVEIQTEGTDSLITNRQVLNIIKNQFDTITKKAIGSLPTAKIEHELKSSPFIKDVDVLITMNRKLKVKIRSFSPLVRIVTPDQTSFYIDQAGYLVPVNPYQPMHVMLANGNINTNISDSALQKNLHFNKLNNFSVIEEIFNLAKQIRASRFLKAQVEQIYRNSDSEYELIPKVGDQLIIFGSASLIDRKLKKLEAIYKQAIPKSGWDTYDAINLKYKNQVVCSK